jgi:DNA adenine methylase
MAHEPRQEAAGKKRRQTGEFQHTLRACKGKVMLSGYPSALYDRELSGWNRHAFDVPNHASGARAKGRETEVLWCNF